MESETKENNKFRGCNVLAIGCLGVFLFICFLFFIVIITKPAFLWNPIAVFFNKKEIVNDPKAFTVEEAKKQIEESIKESSLKNTEIKIHQDIITAVTKESLKNLPNSKVKIKNSELYLYWDLISEKDKKPVYGFVKFVKDEEKIKLDSFGSIRANLKGSGFNGLANFIIKNIGQDESVINSLLGAKDNKLILQNIDFIEENLVLKTDINFNLYD